MKTLRVSVVVILLVGCGRATGPARYELSGSVTYAGKPVPAGFILLTPDASKGNRGPAASASINEGVYRTLPGAGTIGGPHIATLSGSDSRKFIQQGPMMIPQGKPLFTKIEIKLDLPEKAVTHDFAIPAKNK